MSVARDEDEDHDCDDDDDGGDHDDVGDDLRSPACSQLA